jgi:hypothetical protein
MSSGASRWRDAGQGASASLAADRGKQALVENDENISMGKHQEDDEGDEVFVDPDDYGSTLRSMFREEGECHFLCELYWPK